jgi:EAL domain-containing protein (putative c-di-GMP-specific phosphodiesterase class I)
MSETSPNPARCGACREDIELPEFTMAFQPIVDAEKGTIYAHEALVRPPGGGSAADVLGLINSRNMYAFDQSCRVKAIELAAKLGMDTFLSINFMPNAVYSPATCLRKTFEAAAAARFPVHHLMFEVTEAEPSRDPAKLRAIFQEYRRHGMVTAIDDFGAGHSGLNLLAEFQPDVLKIDMALTRNLHSDPVRFAIVKSIAVLSRSLNISVIAEGIETLEEAVMLRHLGIRLFQGFLFARPQVEALPKVSPELLETIRARHEAELLNPADAVHAASSERL